MQWASVSSTDNDISNAIATAVDRLLTLLGREPDLMVVFIAANHRSHFSTVPTLLRRHVESATLVGCLCQNSIGGGREYEDQTTISLLGAILPNVQLQLAHLEGNQLPSTYAERNVWNSALHLSGEPDCMIMLAAPFTFDTEAFLKGLDRHYPSTAKMGGLSSGVDQPNTPCLLLNDHIYSSGVITLGMSGNIAVDTLVAQGVRPVGDPMFANSTHENLVLELDGKTPRDVLTEIYGKLNRSDRQLFTQSLFLGMAMEAQREHYNPGDFLVRSVLGLDPKSGALWVNSPVPINSVVQLHVRDAASAAQEVQQLLQRYRTSPNSRNATGALLLSCTARGANLNDQSNHDSNAVTQALGDIAIGGCFCDGEIGSVRGITYLHSFTSVFGIFREKDKRETH